MIGRIQLPNGSTAELDDGGKWHHPSRQIEEFLNMKFPMTRAPGLFRRLAVEKAAQFFGCDPQLEPEPEFDPTSSISCSQATEDSIR